SLALGGAEPTKRWEGSQARTGPRATGGSSGLTLLRRPEARSLPRTFRIFRLALVCSRVRDYHAVMTRKAQNPTSKRHAGVRARRRSRAGDAAVARAPSARAEGSRKRGAAGGVAASRRTDSRRSVGAKRTSLSTGVDAETAAAIDQIRAANAMV